MLQIKICICVFHEERFTGVCFNKNSSKYVAQVTHEKKVYHCGYFLNKLEAAKAVNAKCVELNIASKNPEVGLPQNKSQVRFISTKQKVKENINSQNAII